MKRKYLDDIGVTARWDNTWNEKRRDKRSKKWKEQRALYGIDDRITWGLNSSLIEDIYERLMRYIECASKSIDLEYHKFFYIDKEYTQLELINLILEDCKYYMINDVDYDPNVESFDDYCSRLSKAEHDKIYKAKEIFEILGIIFPALWW